MPDDNKTNWMSFYGYTKQTEKKNGEALAEEDQRIFFGQIYISRE